MPLNSFLGIFLVLLSLFQGCSREDKEEHAGSDDSLPPESFRILSVEPEDAAEQVSIKTALKVVFNSEINQETVYPESILLVQNSTFMMGADSQTDSDAEANEGPIHSVTLKGPFYISDHEVTVGEYKACVDAGGCSQPCS